MADTFSDFPNIYSELERLIETQDCRRKQIMTEIDQLQDRADHFLDDENVSDQIERAIYDLLRQVRDLRNTIIKLKRILRAIPPSLRPPYVVSEPREN